jgi:hypothetical protein
LLSKNKSSSLSQLPFWCPYKGCLLSFSLLTQPFFLVPWPRRCSISPSHPIFLIAQSPSPDPSANPFLTIHFPLPNIMSRGSSGNIVFDYGLDDRVIEVQSPTGAEDFSSSPCVQTGSGAHPASSPMGAGGPFPGGKARPGRDADHSPPFSVEVKYE